MASEARSVDYSLDMNYLILSVFPWLSNHEKKTTDEEWLRVMECLCECLDCEMRCIGDSLKNYKEEEEGCSDLEFESMQAWDRLCKVMFGVFQIEAMGMSWFDDSCWLNDESDSEEEDNSE